MAYATYMWRLALKPKWIGFHALTIVAFLACAQLGIWQWQRRNRVDAISQSIEFSSRSFIYAFQWWCFAGFVIWFWYRFFKDEYLVSIGEMHREEKK